MSANVAKTIDKTITLYETWIVGCKEWSTAVHINLVDIAEECGRDESTVRKHLRKSAVAGKTTTRIRNICIRPYKIRVSGSIDALRIHRALLGKIPNFTD